MIYICQEDMTDAMTTILASSQALSPDSSYHVPELQYPRANVCQVGLLGALQYNLQYHWHCSTCSLISKSFNIEL